MHFENATEWFSEIQLFDVNEPKEMIRRLAEAVKRVPEGMWISGGDWGAFEAWYAQKKGDKNFKAFLPNKEMIDPVSPNHPVLLKSYDNVYLANSKALEYLRINKHKPKPLGGEYVKNPETGELTGILLGTVGDKAARAMPPKSMARTLIGARDCLAQLRSVGITSIHDISRVDEISQNTIFHTHVERSFSDLNIFLELRKRGELTVRVYPTLTLDVWEDLLEYGITPHCGDEMINYGALKSFVDGSMMLEPYTSAPDYSGNFTFRFLTEEARLNDIMGADRAGFDPATHVIGDKAHHLLLNWYESAMEKNPPRDRRFRLVHAEFITPEDIQRAGRMGLFADITPFHLIHEFQPLPFIQYFHKIEKKYGEKRAKTAFAYRSLIDAGVKLNMVSDWPGSYYKIYPTPVNPMIEMYYAVTRQTLDGNPPGGWHPEQCITIEEAIEAYTINPAYASYEEKIKGSITEGKLADIVVLSDDILTIEPRDLLKTEVLYTIFDGKIIYKK